MAPDCDPNARSGVECLWCRRVIANTEESANSPGNIVPAHVGASGWADGVGNPTRSAPWRGGGRGGGARAPQPGRAGAHSRRPRRGGAYRPGGARAGVSGLQRRAMRWDVGKGRLRGGGAPRVLVRQGRGRVNRRPGWAGSALPGPLTEPPAVRRIPRGIRGHCAVLVPGQRGVEHGGAGSAETPCRYLPAGIAPCGSRPEADSLHRRAVGLMATPATPVAAACGVTKTPRDEQAGGRGGGKGRARGGEERGGGEGGRGGGGEEGGGGSRTSLTSTFATGRREVLLLAARLRDL